MIETIKLYLPKGDIETTRKSVLWQLELYKVYTPDLIYRGFNRKFLDQVLLWGSENRCDHCIYANNEVALSGRDLSANPLYHALINGALAVYRREKLIWEGDVFYTFKDLKTKRDALVAVFV